MCAVLKGYEPQQVLDVFEQLCAIPHGSGNTDRVRDWIVGFAKDYGLDYVQDEYGNVIIRKPATKGYEDHPCVILQGHMDMVAVQTNDAVIDMKEEGLRLAVDGDNIYAKETSLGGDDGIAVAYMLTLIERQDIAHPPLELVFTTDEEVGLAGMSNMDLSSLQGRKLINLDTEDEGVLMAGCAGGKKAVCSIPVQYVPAKGTAYQIKVFGLQGGHSGTEIHKERGNANLILIRTLYALQKKCEIGLAALQGGSKDNVIAQEAEAVIFSSEEKEHLEEIVRSLCNDVKQELAGKDDNVQITLEEQAKEAIGWGKEGCVIAPKDLKQLMVCVLMNPNGVQAMSSSLKDTVETSLNCGIMQLREEDFLVRYALRSSRRSAKEFLYDRIQTFVENLGGTVTTEGDYPPWEYVEGCPFRDQVLEIYEKMFHKPMEVQVIHAGLECGYFFERIAGIQCVSIGPQMENIHSTRETLSISSVKRTWDFLLTLLESL